MKKQRFRSLCAGVMAMLMVFSLVACTGDINGGETTTTTANTEGNTTTSSAVTTTPSGGNTSLSSSTNTSSSVGENTTSSSSGNATSSSSGSATSSSSGSATSSSSGNTTSSSGGKTTSSSGGKTTSSSSTSTSSVSNSVSSSTGTTTKKPDAGDDRTYYMKDTTGKNDLQKMRNLLNQTRQENLVAEGQGKTVKFTIVLEKKTYSFNSTLSFSQNDNLTIEGNGCKWVYTSLVHAIQASNCENLTIKDTTIDYDPLPFTQGVVTGYSGGKMLVKVDAGYRTDVDFINSTIYVSVHDPVTGGVKAGSNVHYTFSSAVSVNSTTIGLVTSSTPISVGEQVSVFQRGIRTVEFIGCKNVLLQDVNVWSGPGAGIYSGRGYGNMHLKRVNVEPGPVPTGGTKRRMRSVNIDALHFTSEVVGPTIDSCTITHSGDDGINVQAFYYHILEVKDSRTIIACPKYDDDMLNVGATLDFCEKDSYDYIGEAKVVSFAKRYDKSYVNKKTTAWANSYHWNNEGDCIYEIKLDRNVNLKAFDHFVPLDRVNAGTVIKNSTFGWNTARGIVVKCPDAVIENNHIEGCTNDGLMALPDLAWAESHFAINLVVRNNTFKNTCLAANSYNSGNVDNIGAIVIGVVPIIGKSGFMDTYGNKNILIEGNTITDSQNYGIVVTNCDGVIVRNNKITNPFYNGVGNVTKVYKVTPNAGILIGKSKNVKVTGNTVKATNRAVTQAVQTSSLSGSVTNSNNTLR